MVPRVLIIIVAINMMTLQSECAGFKPSGSANPNEWIERTDAFLKSLKLKVSEFMHNESAHRELLRKCFGISIKDGYLKLQEILSLAQKKQINFTVESMTQKLREAVSYAKQGVRKASNITVPILQKTQEAVSCVKQAVTNASNVTAEFQKLIKHEVEYSFYSLTWILENLQDAIIVFRQETEKSYFEIKSILEKIKVTGVEIGNLFFYICEDVKTECQYMLIPFNLIFWGCGLSIGIIATLLVSVKYSRRRKYKLKNVGDRDGANCTKREVKFTEIQAKRPSLVDYKEDLSLSENAIETEAIKEQEETLRCEAFVEDEEGIIENAEREYTENMENTESLKDYQQKDDALLESQNDIEVIDDNELQISNANESSTGVHHTEVKESSEEQNHIALNHQSSEDEENHEISGDCNRHVETDKVEAEEEEYDETSEDSNGDAENGERAIKDENYATSSSNSGDDETNETEEEKVKENHVIYRETFGKHETSQESTVLLNGEINNFMEDRIENEQKHEPRKDIHIKVTASEFLSSPSIHKLLALGDNRANLLIEELDNNSTNILEDCLHSYLNAFFKISSLIRSDDKTHASIINKCADAILSKIFQKAEREGKIYLLVNEILVHLGLIKCENKDFKPIQDLTGPLTVMDHALQQSYFHPMAKETLDLFQKKQKSIIVA